ncbi:MAG: hypothetical protein KDB79_14010 [Acidobacteria bacterium]|nr:hypothetical protein [Acidobacteriota bacterium]
MKDLHNEIETAILVKEFEASVLLKFGDVVYAAGAGSQVWNEIDGVWKLVGVCRSSRH